MTSQYAFPDVQPYDADSARAWLYSALAAGHQAGCSCHGCMHARYILHAEDSIYLEVLSEFADAAQRPFDASSEDGVARSAMVDLLSLRYKREKTDEERAEYYKLHSAAWATYYDTNYERIRAQQAVYRERNRDDLMIAARASRAAMTPEERSAASAAATARTRARRAAMTPEQREAANRTAAARRRANRAAKRAAK